MSVLDQTNAIRSAHFCQVVMWWWLVFLSLRRSCCVGDLQVSSFACYVGLLHTK